MANTQLELEFSRLGFVKGNSSLIDSSYLINVELESFLNLRNLRNLATSSSMHLTSVYTDSRLSLIAATTSVVDSVESLESFQTELRYLEDEAAKFLKHRVFMQFTLEM